MLEEPSIHWNFVRIRAILLVLYILKRDPCSSLLTTHNVKNNENQSITEADSSAGENNDIKPALSRSVITNGMEKI
ncbi:MAG: hypothetical protein ACTSVI_04785 [Promethearchaeota archaeon]